ncbi:hypothetical protein AAFF_G00185550 [Aldrovandia affinis]|uniref:Uncharacterized protein n=1 Tax=Aldrovandia affinis TaxID=143900 RepID=A0AAD7RJS9_9TELE|nr:hypothetical protein AAFF_G00185550 [Aldrovandia affinis]
MLHDRGPEVTVYDNSQLRNTWEARSKQFSEKTLNEKERRKKSALPQLFDQWQTRLAFRTGASAEKKAQTEANTSAHHKQTFSSSTLSAEDTSPRAAQTKQDPQAPT